MKVKFITAPFNFRPGKLKGNYANQARHRHAQPCKIYVTILSFN